MTTWNELRNELNLSQEEEELIRMEKEIIMALINARKENGWTQKHLAEVCGVKQPFIARLEKNINSARIDSMLKLLVPLGYTLKVVPIDRSDV